MRYEIEYWKRETIKVVFIMFLSVRVTNVHRKCREGVDVDEEELSMFGNFRLSFPTPKTK